MKKTLTLLFAAVTMLFSMVSCNSQKSAVSFAHFIKQNAEFSSEKNLETGLTETKGTVNNVFDASQVKRICPDAYFNFDIDSGSITIYTACNEDSLRAALKDAVKNTVAVKVVSVFSGIK